VADDKLRARLDPYLDELRLTTAELRAQAQLSMGLHDRVVADLVPLVSSTPTRERLVGCLMTGLYRSGRQADALGLYRQTRAVLGDELGIEPGRQLQALHERILRTDPALDRPPMPIYAVQVADQWLPWNTSGSPVLEFCNTYAGWGFPPRRGSDWLGSYATLAVWAGHHDLTDARMVSRLRQEAERDPTTASLVLDSARQLRTHLYACLTNTDDRDAFDSVAGYAEAATKLTTFQLGEDGLGRWSVVSGAGLHLPVHAVARAAADLLADPRRFTVRACPAPECGWLFLDHTGQRRYCNTALCAESASQSYQVPRAGYVQVSSCGELLYHG
jgi:SARP family transcriptional regulator, regulator of embCAB operon